MIYDRYKTFRVNGDVKFPPFIPIREKNTDEFVIYEKGKSRLDLISQEFYESPDFAWLILQANPQYGGLEFLIPDKSELRIPYPLNETLTGYEGDISYYLTYKNI